jgi:hypothetical protein
LGAWLSVISAAAGHGRVRFGQAGGGGSSPRALIRGPFQRAEDFLSICRQLSVVTDGLSVKGYPEKQKNSDNQLLKIKDPITDNR